MKFKSIRGKLLVLISVGMIIVAAVVLHGFNSAWQSIGLFEQVILQEVDNERQITNMALEFKKQVQEWKNVLLRGADSKQLEKYWGKFEKTEAAIQSSGAGLQQRLEGQTKQLVMDFLQAHKTMGVAYRKGLEVFKSSGFDHHAGDKAVAGIDRAPTELLENAAKEISRQASDTADLTIVNSKDDLLLSVIILVVVFILTAAFIVLFVNAQVVRPAIKIQNLLEKIAAGDLSRFASIESRDEFGRIAGSVNQVQKHLGEVIRRLVSVAGQVNGSSEDVSSITESNLQALSRQRGEMEMVATAMNEMTMTIQEVAKNATETAQQAKDADQLAEQGNQKVSQVIGAISQLSNEIQGLAGEVQALEADSTEIGSVVEVIHNIAEQTNLLALNAAIEAARAGEQGRGFAVVADEVRTLADRTRKSTQDIQAMIERLQQGTRKAASAMQQGTKKVESTVELAEEAGKALGQITRGINIISGANIQIASAAEEQGAVAEEINRNIVSANDLAVQVHESGAATSQSTHKLAELSTEMVELSAHFKLADGD
ncbi:methyl-accepting chemotaxis protein [Sedimenticola selenatireducens]|uniref:methyl-accepting chemotaxis protein n=1 Tax=Sedimenticola selenatireducens TaxID=191960 RepID=UPI002AAC069E|nr:methyl-accepting chemotaxis protein [Sedimenticola selenatireducens]